MLITTPGHASSLGSARLATLLTISLKAASLSAPARQPLPIRPMLPSDTSTQSAKSHASLLTSPTTSLAYVCWTASPTTPTPMPLAPVLA